MCGSGGSADVDSEAKRQREKAVTTILHALEQLHGNVVWEEYDHQYFVVDWYSDRYTQGGFALYGPSQFTEMFPFLVQPAAGGRLHFAGEATSVHHAWIVGSLNSAYRAVYEILDFEGLESKKEALVRLWNKVDECDFGDFDPNPHVPEPSTPHPHLIRQTSGQKKHFSMRWTTKLTLETTVEAVES